jgi:hypothetical protein
MVFVDATSFSAQPEYTLTEYFAKDCGHCKALAPVWDNAHNQAMGSDNATKVEWVQKECYGDNWAPGKDHAICEENGISAFPTIILQKPSTGQEWLVPPLTGSTEDQKAEQLNQFVDQHTGNNLKVSNVAIEPTVMSSLLNTCSGYSMFENFL